MAIFPDALARAIFHQIGLCTDPMHLACHKLPFVFHAVFGASVDPVALALALEEHAFVGVAICHGLKTVTVEFVVKESSFICLSVDVAAKCALACDHPLDELPCENVAVGLGSGALPMGLPLHPTAIVCLAIGPCAPPLTVWLVIFPLTNVTPAIWPFSGTLAMPLPFLPVAFVTLTRWF